MEFNQNVKLSNCSLTPRQRLCKISTINAPFIKFSNLQRQCKGKTRETANQVNEEESAICFKSATTSSEVPRRYRAIDCLRETAQEK